MPGGIVFTNEAGDERFVYEEDFDSAKAEGWQPKEGQTAFVEDPTGSVAAVPAGELPGYLGNQPSSRIADQRRVDIEQEQRIEEETFGGAANTAAAVGLGALRGGSLGGSDVLLRALGADMEAIESVRRINPWASIGGEIGGAAIPALFGGGSGAAALLARTPAGLVARGGAAIGRGGGLARGVAAGVFEGGAFGLGEGVTELALSGDPLTAEKITSTLSSNALYGAGIGGAASIAGKALEKGLKRAKGLADEVAAKAKLGKLGDEAADLASLDRKGLRAAKDAEFERIRASRVDEGFDTVDQIREYKAAIDDANLWSLTKNAKKGSRLSKVGGRNKGTFRQIEKMLDTPKSLAKRPSLARSSLEKVEQSLMDLAEEAPGIRQKLAAEGRLGGSRARALDRVEDLLERNRALQGRIEELTTPIRESVTPRLEAIREAEDALMTGAGPKSFPQKVAEGAVVGATMGIAAPLIGGAGAAMAGAKLADKLGSLVFGRAAKPLAEGQLRMAKAISRLASAAEKGTRAAPVLATKVLSGVRYSQARQEEPPKKKRDLAGAYKERSREILEQVRTGPDGQAKMSPGARQAMADRLSGVRAVSPALADQMEATAARRVEYLASKLPKRPPIGLQAGPDTWRPSSLAMRAFARHAAAVEDPAGVLERAADGTITPEDAEALRTVYPELYSDIKRQIVEKLPELRKRLPYKKRLALSILTGIPVDPALEPQILRQLQASFSFEPGTDGGTHAPVPQPQFGSVKKSAPEPTPAQERAG